MKHITLLLLVLGACKSSGASSGAACDPGATELAKKLRDDKSLEGKTFAFKNCAFDSQGNDIVSFAATKGAESIACHMKGGEAGVKTLRQAAMKLDLDKLKLDVAGKVTKGEMTECTMTAHE